MRSAIKLSRTSGADRGGSSSGYNTAFLLLLIAVPAWAQSVTITAPANGALLQAVNLTNGRELAITSTVTEGSAYHTYRVCATANSRPINPQNCSYAAPWTIKAYPGLWGDGAVDYVVTTYDISGNVLATSPTVTATTRLIGLANSVTAAPTSGLGTISVSKWNATNQGGACGMDLYIDGFPITSSASPYSGGGTCTSVGENWTNFDTTKWRNGNHEIFVDMHGGSGLDPFVTGNTFTAGNIAGGTTITLTAPQNHYLVTNRPVFFTTTGTLPTPLVAGAFWGPVTSATSPTKLAVGAVCASGSCTVTLNASPGVSIGGVVDVEGWTHDGAGNQPIYELAACEGRFVVTGASGNTFTYTNAACPDNTAHNDPPVLAVTTNAFYAIYTSATTAQFATAANGSAITLGAGSSGTHTVSAQITGYWNDTNAGYPGAYTFGDGSPIAFARKVVDFENGAAPIEYRPAFLEMNGVVGTNGPSLCGSVVNTDGSTTPVTCSAVTYTVVPDGGFTGVVTVNATTGVPTFTGAGWAQISSTYSTFPAVTMYVHVYTGSVTFKSFRRNGSIGAYLAGQSFIPTSAWFMDCMQATPIQSADIRRFWLTQLMFESGYNTCFTNPTGPDVVNPNVTSCPLSPLPIQNDVWIRQWADDWKTKYGTPVSFETTFQALDNGVPTGPGPLYNNSGFDRQTCVKNYIANQKADGRYHMLFGTDEANVYLYGNNPNFNGLIGGPNMTNVTVSGGTGTFTGSLSMGSANVWNQANGTGAAVYFSGASTNPCLNGWRYPLAADGNNGTPTTTFTFASPCGAIASAAVSDPGLTISWISGAYLGSVASGANSPHGCVLPRYLGTGLGSNFTAVSQSWSTATDINGSTLADTTMSSIVSDGTTYTIHATGHGWAEGHAIRIAGASTASLNGMYNIHVVDANTVTTPGTVGNTAPAGTYNSSTDSGLTLSYDCGLPSNYPVWLRSLLHAGGDIATNEPIIGTTYNYGPGVAAWNNPTVEDAANLYFAQAEGPIYGEAGTVYSVRNGLFPSGLGSRAYQSQTKKMLLGTHGMYYNKHHTGYLFDPAQDTPEWLYWRPETQVAGVMISLAWGVTGFRTTWYQNANQTEYLTFPGTMSGGSRIGPENAKMWAAISRSFQATQHLNQYILQPHANSPYMGLMYPTLQTTSSFGNMLLVPCMYDGGTTDARTVDLTGIRQAGGSIYRMSLTGYRLRFDALAGNPASDTYTFCGGGIAGSGAGETVAYVAQPSGAASDLTPTTFTPPSPLAYGASHYAIRYGYYPRDMADDPVQACDAGCTINLMRTGGPVWLQILYLDANHLPLATGDPQMLAGQ
jgi:hypothetical protein